MGVTPSFFSAATPALGAGGMAGMETPSLSGMGGMGAGGMPMTPEAYQVCVGWAGVGSRIL